MNNFFNPSPCKNCKSPQKMQDGNCQRTLTGHSCCKVWEAWFGEEWRKMQDLFGATNLKKIREYHKDDDAGHEG